jgi:hypothetical protein
MSTVRFYCDLQYDPFLYMAQNKKVYGWVISIVETPNTIPTLFETMLDWRKEVEKSNTGLSKFGSQVHLADYDREGQLWDFFLQDPSRDRWGRLKAKEEYNMCHFWTNFEIGDLRFFRGKEYQSLFNYLDRKGGFYLERVRGASVTLVVNVELMMLLYDSGVMRPFEAWRSACWRDSTRSIST